MGGFYQPRPGHTGSAMTTVVHGRDAHATAAVAESRSVGATGRSPLSAASPRPSASRKGTAYRAPIFHHVPRPWGPGTREGTKMDEPHFFKNIGPNKRHSCESRNPVFYTWESGLQIKESQGGLAVLGGLAALGAVTPGFLLSQE